MTAEVSLPVNVLGTVGNEMRDYWVRRSAASEEASSMLCMLIRKGRYTFAVFMDAARL